ncbi:MAG TPA: ATP-dependent protease ATPase subunit HslU, partial [Savagea sp.]
MTKQEQYTPRQLTEYLDKYIIGQEEAKRAIAVAVRNRYRRMRLPEEVREEVIPKNILMIGPTGVGKTEIARRMAKFIEAPFIKVEATKFTEVGYVGRDVESIIRDLVEVSVRLVKEKMREDVKEEAARNAEKRLIELLVPKKKQKKQQGMTNPFEMLFGQQQEEQQDPQEETERKRKRSEIGAMLRIGKLEDELVELDVAMPQSNVLGMMPGANAEQLGQLQDALSSLIPTQKTKRTMKVKDARKVLEEEEADKLLDEGKVARLAIELTEQSGIVFIDEFDKIASRNGSQQSQDVSREGVQRDILPIVEGSQVTTKYGVVRTDFILFIAAGAFHISKPSDIIPELQGRFPIRVELNKL